MQKTSKELYLEWLSKAAKVTTALKNAYLSTGYNTFYEAAETIQEAKNMLKASVERQDSGL